MGTTPKSQEELMTKERSYIFEARVEDAQQCKELGAAAHKADERNRAIQFYERALYHVDFDEGTWAFELLDNHRDAVNEVRLPVYLNLAACHLALDDGDMQKVLENCDLALQIDKDNVKALYRKGQAYLNTNDLDAAIVVLKKAAALNPTDKAIRQAWTTCKERLELAKIEEKKRWGGRLLDESSSKNSPPQVVPDENVPTTQTTSLAWVLAGLVPLLAVVVAYVLWGL
ncbi:hypothetical protein H257_04271 [Aphanomyces astaci]|uniref:Uncharacterized protein n=1 Tax=Aphanomyces astaci TaxID=112090 RepID=W4GXF3_APHAT|nr:hypothetical protein H257_04271 [Aphanomyces astaci]ETV83568.1 hypothetical protein H257_04271 [Aphanomyces astaci]|eukprot:XP_009826998.1 hypothetical protein H257_04271 [Aphanomyces astaci]